MIYQKKKKEKCIIITNKKNLQNETNRISIEYEKKIHNILNETDNSKEKLVKVINDRENDNINGEEDDWLNDFGKNKEKDSKEKTEEDQKKKMRKKLLQVII